MQSSSRRRRVTQVHASKVSSCLCRGPREERRLDRWIQCVKSMLAVTLLTFGRLSTGGSTPYSGRSKDRETGHLAPGRDPSVSHRERPSPSTTARRNIMVQDVRRGHEHEKSIPTPTPTPLPLTTFASNAAHALAWTQNPAKEKDTLMYV